MSDAGDSNDDLSDLELESGRRTSRYTTAGNEADVEDNDGAPPTPSPEELKELMRRSAPEECAPPTPCKLHPTNDSKDKNDSEPRKPSSAERLTTRPKSGVEMLSDTIEKPKGVVPPLALPQWHCLSLDNKIPLLPAPKGFMYYTPGKVGVKLQREPKLYSVDDPYNRERIVRCPYTVLNDPHGRSFVHSPTTKKVLYRQGFINENDEVMVPLCQFNRYRDYLRTLFTDDLKKTFQTADELYKKEREQMRMIHQFFVSGDEGKSAEWMRRVNDMKKYAMMANNFRTTTAKQKQEQTNARMRIWNIQREQLYAQRIMQNASRGKIQEEKRRVINEGRRLAACRTIQLAAMKNFKAAERRMQDQEMFKKAMDNYRMEWMGTKIEQSSFRVQREHEISTYWKQNLESNAKIRQKRFEAMRADIPHSIERRKEAERKRWEIARKYFYIWLEKVRRNRPSPLGGENSHESAWIRGAASSLDDTVKFLRFQTDTHDKLDNFILSILRLKAAIKKQMELEGDSDNEEEEDDKSTIASSRNKTKSLTTTSVRTVTGSGRSKVAFSNSRKGSL